MGRARERIPRERSLPHWSELWPPLHRRVHLLEAHPITVDNA